MEFLDRNPASTKKFRDLLDHDDIFVFNQNSGSQTIADFHQGQDRIELDGFFSGANDAAFTNLLNSLHAAADTAHVIDLGGGHAICSKAAMNARGRWKTSRRQSKLPGR